MNTNSLPTNTCPECGRDESCAVCTVLVADWIADDLAWAYEHGGLFAFADVLLAVDA
jgi:hypothetical protein